MDNYGSSTQVVTTTGAGAEVSGAIRLELDFAQGNIYTAADRTSSPGGLTEFPAPGEITLKVVCGCLQILECRN